MSRFTDWLRGLWWRGRYGRTPRDRAVADLEARERRTQTITRRPEGGCGPCALLLVFLGIGMVVAAMVVVFGFIVLKEVL